MGVTSYGDAATLLFNTTGTEIPLPVAPSVNIVASDHPREQKLSNRPGCH